MSRSGTIPWNRSDPAVALSTASPNRKPRRLKLHDKLVERIGKLKAKSRGTSQHYDVTLATNEDGKTVSAITWLKLLAPVQICGYLPVRQRFWPAPVGGGVGRL